VGTATSEPAQNAALASVTQSTPADTTGLLQMPKVSQAVPRVCTVCVLCSLVAHLIL